MIQKHLIQFFFLVIVCTGYSQTESKDSYSLDDCITIALANNLDFKSSGLNAHTEKINFQQSKANLLPSINGNFNLGVNTGRSIDPFTNDFVNQEFTFSNAGLNLDATIFNGFRLINTAKQNRLNTLAAEMEREAAQQDLILNVTLAYLQVLNSRDNLQLAKQRLETTNKQLSIQKEFYENESGNPADYTDIVAQKTIDETSIIVAESALNNAKLNLVRLLNLNDELHLEAKDLMLDMTLYQWSADEVYTDALENLATFKARALRIDAAKKGVHVAKAQFTPDISIFAGLNTNYSSAAQTFSEAGSSIVETGDFVTVDNQDLPVFTEQTTFNSQSIDFRDQLDNNLSTVVGFSVSVPLFNGFRAKYNVAREKIKVEESLLELERTHLDIKNTIKQVHFDMNASYLRYESLQKQVEAFEESYRINEIRFNSGVSNFLNFVTSKNNLDNAKLNLNNAKYEYILRVKVLEYYRGEF
ncbi:TolC family protein [Psychroserpens sp. SPM9]|uniref:TolC family protein n=1 Tax=Psychroserpens sp. SPM9 TaxID=2975598 RepID=UPI0021A7BB48|nr:TolC family protein [Psychroserpens sp. SPM9]MDG5492735.1 TolC family protein [Psychroserpens sp. SPM9]